MRSISTSWFNTQIKWVLSFRKDEAPVKGLQNLARQLLSTPEYGNEEDGHVPSSHGFPGNARHRFQRDKGDDPGLSPVASFLLHRLVSSPRPLEILDFHSDTVSTF